MPLRRWKGPSTRSVLLAALGVLILASPLLWVRWREGPAAFGLTLTAGSRQGARHRVARELAEEAASLGLRIRLRESAARRLPWPWWSEAASTRPSSREGSASTPSPTSGRSPP